MTKLVIVNAESDRSGHLPSRKTAVSSGERLRENVAERLGWAAMRKELKAWRHSRRLLAAGIAAVATGMTVDQVLGLFAARSFSATSRGSLSILPKSKKSKVKLKRSTKA